MRRVYLPIRRLSVTTHGLRINSWVDLPSGSLDVNFDGRRVWSFHPTRKRGVIEVEWPAGLLDRLQGKTLVSVAPSGGGTVLASQRATFGGSNAPLDLRDRNGRAQVVNKWGELTTEFAESDPEIADRILRLAHQISGTLEDAGHTVMITSGTLLGWVRCGSLLPNDDDADIALLVTSSESPADVAIIGLEVRRLLSAAGFSVTLHSAAHLQVQVGGSGPEADSYCDIFLGFFRDGIYCQPFHLRSRMARSSLEPVQRVDLAGYRLPAPPVPADWLAACYGLSWRTPDPGFTFDTPNSTRARYENWFGSFNFGRSYWDGFARADAVKASPLSSAHARAVTSSAERVAATTIVDAGCGTGRHTEAIAGSRTIRAFDFSRVALRIARVHLPQAAQVLNINLADGRDVLEEEIAITMLGPAVLSFHEVLHTLTVDTRANALQLARATLRAGGAVVATFPSELELDRYTFRDPMSWHLPVEQLAEEAAACGLRLATPTVSVPASKSRTRTTVELAIATDTNNVEAEGMIS